MVVEINILKHTEPGDEAAIQLELQGPSFEVEICCPDEQVKKLSQEGAPIPEPIRGLALIDPGAFATSISQSHISTLRLIQTGTKSVGTTFSNGRVPTYSCKFNIVGDGSFNVKTVTALDLPDKHIVALLGRDFLAHCVLIYDGKQGTVKLTIG